MRIMNKRVSFNYELFDRFETGVVLSGPEVKSLILGQASLNEAYVKIINGEAFLINAHIHPYQYADRRQADAKRTRKLLLHKKELLVIVSKMQQKKLILVPVSWYNKGRQIKLEIALAKPKKMWQKREALKKADLAREAEAELASY